MKISTVEIKLVTTVSDARADLRHLLGADGALAGLEHVGVDLHVLAVSNSLVEEAAPMSDNDPGAPVAVHYPISNPVQAKMLLSYGHVLAFRQGDGEMFVRAGTGVDYKLQEAWVSDKSNKRTPVGDDFCHDRPFSDTYLRGRRFRIAQ